MKNFIISCLIGMFATSSFANDECTVYVPVDDNLVGIHAIFVLDARNTYIDGVPRLVIEADDGKRNLEIVIRMESADEAEYASKRITEMVKTCKRKLV